MALHLSFGSLAVALTAVLAPDRPRPYLVGAIAASAAWYLAITVVIGSGSANWMHGLEGEELTSDALRRLCRRGWALIDDVPVPGIGNIDHALVGPGGAYAIESKHPRDPMTVAQQHDACAQARASADRLHHLLATVDINLRLTVAPVLVVWGEVLDGAQTGSVVVLTGRDLRRWRDSLPTGPIDSDQIARARAGLLRIIRTREDEKRRREGPHPLIVELGPFGILNHLATGVGAGLGSWTATGFALRVLGGSGLVPLLIATSAIGFASLRVRRVRIMAVGWLAGAGAMWLLLAGFYVADWLR